MNNYKIEIITNTKANQYNELENLIKEFAINVYVTQKLNLYNYPNFKKQEIIKNYKNTLSNTDLEILENDICYRINFAKESINAHNKNIITRFYILLEDNRVIGFQTAQVRNNNEIFEGWRNFAYIRPEYSGKTGLVLDTYNKFHNGFLSNIVYENITDWFKEYGVSKEKTATGKKMYKNILVYIIKKGFIPYQEDERRVYLVKDYSVKKTKKELKKIYYDYISKNN